MVSIDSMVMRAQFRWAGHVVRMDEDGIPKSLFYCELVKGHRCQAGQKKRYKDCLTPFDVERPVYRLLGSSVQDPSSRCTGRHVYLFWRFIQGAQFICQVTSGDWGSKGLNATWRNVVSTLQPANSGQWQKFTVCLYCMLSFQIFYLPSNKSKVDCSNPPNIFIFKRKWQKLKTLM